MTMELDTILCGDSLNVLKALPESSVHCCVTSPPYYGLRDYGMDVQIGREATPEEYISRLTAVFREVRRVLRPDGNLVGKYRGQLLRPQQQRRYPRPQISAGAQRTEYFPLPNGARLQAKGHDRHSVDAGLCAPRRRLVSAQRHNLGKGKSYAGNYPNDRCTRSHEHIFLAHQE